jgi:hypothetical protein
LDGKLPFLKDHDFDYEKTAAKRTGFSPLLKGIISPTTNTDLNAPDNLSSRHSVFGFLRVLDSVFIAELLFNPQLKN